MERVAPFCCLRAIMAATVPSGEREAGQPGASVASEVLSGSRKEEGEEERRSPVEALEEEAALSCLEAQAELRRKERNRTIKSKHNQRKLHLNTLNVLPE